MDNYLEEKNNLHHLIASGALGSRGGELNAVIDQVEEVLGKICGNRDCEGVCGCQKEGNDDLMMDLEEMTRDERKEEK